MKPTILFFITEDWYFWSHRLSVARAAKDAGFQVLIVTRIHQHKERIEKEGFKLIPIRLERRSKNVIKEFFNILKIIKIYCREKPDIVHHVAMKPVLYGSWAARITGIPAVVNALAGLGFTFVIKGWKASILRWLIIIAYRLAFLNKNTIGIFQNPEDLKVFIDAGILKSEKAVLIRGSGVDTSRFIHLPEPSGIPIIVLASRMLWHKGIEEFVDAARQLRKDGVKSHFVSESIDAIETASTPSGNRFTPLSDLTVPRTRQPSSSIFAHNSRPTKPPAPVIKTEFKLTSFFINPNYLNHFLKLNHF